MSSVSHRSACVQRTRRVVWFVPPLSRLTGYASNILQNQPVASLPSTGGGETKAPLCAAIGAASSAPSKALSSPTATVVVACRTSGLPRSGTDIVAYVTLDPTIVYEIQSNAALTSQTLASSTTSLPSGNTTTGLSQQMMLDVASPPPMRRPPHRYHCRSRQQLWRHLRHRAGPGQRTSERR
jgi:hypothetical protein